MERNTNSNVAINEKKYLSVTEAVQYTGLSQAYMYNLVHQEGFPSVRIGRRILIDRAKMEGWFETAGQAV